MSNPLFDLEGKTALVTGSSRGLGNAIARGLADAGARVVLNGMSVDRLTAAAEAMRGLGHDVLHQAFDVVDEDSVVAAFDAFDRDGIEIDILVNNAGIQYRKPMLDLSAKEWQSVIDTNLTAAFIVAREAARRMIRRGRGKIINIGSVMSQAARATIAPYTASKGAIKLLTQSMTAEWAHHGIQVNAIGPGYMETDMNEALINDPAFNGWVTQRTPSRRWGKPRELAGTAVYLASDASSYVNGQMIYVDGGMLAVL